MASGPSLTGWYSREKAGLQGPGPLRLTRLTETYHGSRQAKAIGAFEFEESFYTTPLPAPGDLAVLSLRALGLRSGFFQPDQKQPETVNPKLLVSKSYSIDLAWKV